MELAGVIESVGRKVTRFQTGDAVFASTFAVNFGGYAEYKCFPQKAVLAHKPTNLTFEEAAAAPGAGMTALACLAKGHIQPGQTVLVYGASGAVGTNAVQLAAHHFGADVTGICSTANLALVKSLGASRVIDYTREDFTEAGERYDVIFDAVGKLSPEQQKRARAQASRFLNVHVDSDGANKLANLLALKAIIEAGKLKPTIDRVYRFEQIVEAHRYVEQGHKKGNVVITVAHPE
jgi:NADPH:quinone reductase-like Zn-dependent oxidoreductase